MANAPASGTTKVTYQKTTILLVMYDLNFRTLERFDHTTSSATPGEHVDNPLWDQSPRCEDLV